MTRGGRMIEVPSFWAAFVLELPSGVDELRAAEAIASIGGGLVWYAEPHYVGHLDGVVPGDTLYSEAQYSLKHPISQNVDINAEGAWRLTTGTSNVKVGVYDTGLDYRHEDFGGGTFQTSKIVGGWDWVNNMSIPNTPAADIDPPGHGTACAGIIGALRNNNQTGIAGIAGGDVDDGGGTGCQLFAMKISNGPFMSNFVTYALIYDAIVEGAAFSPGYGYGLHVQNHSWGNSTSSYLLRDAIQFANRNDAVVVCSRGNSGDDRLHYPACYFDDWVLSVGASDERGFRHDNSVPASG